MPARLLRITLILLLALSTTGCLEKTSPAQSARILAFGTLIDVTIVGKSKQEAKTAMEQLEALFARLHRDWHAWEPGLLQQTNEKLAGCSAFEPPAALLPLITLSVPLAEASEHLFEPAIGHLIDLWGFQGKKPDCAQLPSEESVLNLLQQAPRMSDLKLDAGLLRSDNPAVKLDFGAIGKGYGIDMAIQLLRDLGIAHAMINAGGDLRAIGDRGGRPWRIGVKHPDGSVLASLEISGDESVFTSGNYERQYRCNGQRYHHIIDPRSGYPAEGTDSVTVIHPNAATADAAATALFIAGPDDWQRIARRMGIKYVALLDDRGRLYMTAAMEKRLKVLNTRVSLHVLAAPAETDNSR
jgi:thiamine biosynthesis lipoprotein